MNGRLHSLGRMLSGPLMGSADALAAVEQEAIQHGPAIPATSVEAGALSQPDTPSTEQIVSWISGSPPRLRSMRHPSRRILYGNH